MSAKFKSRFMTRIDTAVSADATGNLTGDKIFNARKRVLALDLQPTRALG